VPGGVGVHARDQRGHDPPHLPLEAQFFLGVQVGNEMPLDAGEPACALRVVLQRRAQFRCR
jgi:hypothetical protein